ncbi:MAG: AAA family ATPase [Pseudomonadales bacterium]|nr:AAA family ATPase [Pseudomonadales bacterium]
MSMYLEYFSLTRHPFRITPDTSLFYSGGDDGRGVVLDAMMYAIETGEGILKVVGEVGSGKTMLCRMLEERIPETTELVYLANPNLSAEDILYAIAFELKLPIRRDTTKLLVMQQLQNYLLKQHAANRKVLVIIEEAQGMPLETLEEIRLFSNLETHRDKLMQIILFGQPELDKNLSAKHIRQLRERITHSFYLNPLTAEQTGDYIRFRLGAAGCPCPHLFTERAEWLIAKASGGLTRRINILADKALLAAFAENVLESPENLSPDVPPVVTARHVIAAIRDSEYFSFAFKSLFSPLRMAGASMVVAATVLGFIFWPLSAGEARQSQQDVIPIEAPIFNMPLENEPANVSAAESILTPIAIDASVVPEPPTELLEEVAAAEMPEQEAAMQTAAADFESVQPASGPGRFVPGRVLASIDWLQDANADGYTVQFMSGETNNMDFAESFLAVLDEEGLLDESYICMSIVEGESYWTIKHGTFDGLSVAQTFIDQLPSQLYDYKPFVQNISSVECNANFSVAALILE